MSCPVYHDGDPDRLQAIPSPKENWFGLLGHIPEMDPSFPIRSVWKLADSCGPIMKLNLKNEMIVMSSQKYVNEMCDESRFEKIPTGPLVELRALVGDGLFTAYPSEPNWAKAHRLLVPAFGPLGIRSMFGGMLDISSQLVLKWDRLGPENEIDMADDLTRLAFDTIGLCAFSYRFNEFYGDRAHPFAEEMARVLLESGKRAFRPGLVNQLYSASEKERQEDIRKMHSVADELIAERKRNPQPDNKDLLNTMLSATDPKTGEKLSDENIRFNLVTFLLAGHETTSATLCFLYYNWLKNPEALAKAQEEVDRVVGDRPLTVDHLPRLNYIDACIKETLRLSSPIPTFLVKPKHDTVVGGQFPISSDSRVQCNMFGLHMDPAVWGDDAQVFRPERMLGGGFTALPPNSWKPFGNGKRACIGRGFAEQEMIMNAALVLQRFHLEFADPDYELEIVSTLTLKPKGFKMRVCRRPGKSGFVGLPRSDGAEAARTDTVSSPVAGLETGNRSPITILFGGNTGTCQGFALDLETRLMGFGFAPMTKPLDDATEDLPTDRPVIIITASYEGLPPDNATNFVKWLEHTSTNDVFRDLKYAVFGVGNSNWPSTFHRIPKLVDSTLKRLGATAIAPIGTTDAKSDLLGPWDSWSARLIQMLTGPDARSADDAPSLSLSLTPGLLPRILAGEEFQSGTVTENREIAEAGTGFAKRHMEVRLPAGQTYEAGDYLVVQPRNAERLARRVLRHFGISEHDTMVVQCSRKQFMPSTPTSVLEFLRDAVELGTPITRRQIDILVASSAKEEHRAKLNQMKSDSVYPDLLEQRRSILDIIQQLGLDTPFGTYIDMLQPLSPRQYSISSAPAPAHEEPQLGQIVSITFDVHCTPTASNEGSVDGIASTYLASRCIGDQIFCSTKSTNVNFRLPPDPKTPILMIAAGTGIAPMRGLLQERARLAAGGCKRLGAAILFYGCRHPGKDFLYQDELRAWEEMGIVRVIPAFSRPSQGQTHQYVQDAMWDHRGNVSELFFNQGATVYVCGSAARLGRSVADCWMRLYMEKTKKGHYEAEEWLRTVRNSRYISDVY
ncbi:hypothetical protein N8T08_000942 [Aspergillus melleus]|uniref:Uncharacterized protein n=1 Tax=Aspergillus melleus TaxID=138277 RepID=A0ACC3BBI7_9EURO|nr:hypothetical protein N8T08_000942 [Aspergillus melleus]